MSMFPRILALTTTLIGVSCVCQWTYAQQPRQVDLDVDQVSALDAAIRIGQVFDRPLGIICADASIATIDVSLHLPGATVESAFNELLRNLQQYEWRDEGGVIVFRPHEIPEPAQRLLEIVIPRFAARKARTAELSDLLWMEVQLQMDPTVQGFYGLRRSRDDAEIGPLDMAGANVESILNEIVRRRKKAAWIVPPAPAKLLAAQNDRLWAIVTYAHPPEPLSDLCCINMSYFS